MEIKTKTFYIPTVFEILVRVAEGKSWTDAILQTIPPRKGAKPKQIAGNTAENKEGNVNDVGNQNTASDTEDSNQTKDTETENSNNDKVESSEPSIENAFDVQESSKNKCIDETER